MTPDAPSVGVDPGETHAATTQDDQGQVTHYHYTGTRSRKSAASRTCADDKLEVPPVGGGTPRRTRTNLRPPDRAERHRRRIVGKDFGTTRRSARGTHEKPGTNVKAKRGLSRALDYSRPGELKQEVKRASERRGAVWNLHPAKNTSRRCAQCGHTAKKNRESQAAFRCRGWATPPTPTPTPPRTTVRWLLAKADGRHLDRRHGRRKPTAKASRSTDAPRQRATRCQAMTRRRSETNR